MRSRPHEAAETTSDARTTMSGSTDATFGLFCSASTAASGSVAAKPLSAAVYVKFKRPPLCTTSLLARPRTSATDFVNVTMYSPAMISGCRALAFAAAKLGRDDSGPIGAFGADVSVQASARHAIAADAQTGRRVPPVPPLTALVVFPIFPRGFGCSVGRQF
jgi:hypothetical protein